MRVLSLVGDKLSRLVGEEVPDAEVVVLPVDRPLPAGTRGDVLWSMGSSPALQDLQADIAWVHIHGTGVDAVPPRVFDGRTVTCSRGATAEPIAEFVLAAMLAFEKQLPGIWLDRPPENWGTARLGGLTGRQLAVLGMGAIGTAVARLGLSFGMQVRAVRRTGATSPLPAVQLVGTALDAVRGADHGVAAVPATPRTRHLLGKELLCAMQPGRTWSTSHEAVWSTRTPCA